MSGLHQTKLDNVIDRTTKDMILRIEGIVYEAPEYRRKKAYIFTEYAKHPTWQHALIAGLPGGALFRRRLLGNMFGISPAYKETRVTHTVRTEGRALFPDMTQKFPDSFGPVQYVTQTHEDTYVRTN